VILETDDARLRCRPILTRLVYCGGEPLWGEASQHFQLKPV
jgi:hypothetical protein